MKQNTEELDYRSMNEVQLKKELKKLEDRILEFVGDPLDYKHISRFLRWSGDDTGVEAVQEMMSDRCCILNLLFDIHCTDKEIARLKKVNDLLLDLTNRTHKRTAALFRTLIAMPKEELDDDYEIEGKLVPEFDIPYSTLRLEDDDYYGSDFIRMAAILQETEKNKSGMADVSCDWTRLKDKTPSATDEELECANIMDDEDSWAEGPLRHPKLAHIKICYALRALCTHMNWSIPDVLRINDFSIDVKLTVQQFSDQEKNRLWWWDKYDLPRFKEVLLKEVAARPEGLPLETALLQRCRDYFEDSADEVLAEVGISDIDRYLEALKHKIAHPYQE